MCSSAEARKAFLALAAVALTVGCGDLPSLEHRTFSKTLSGEATRLGKAVAPLAEAYPGTSGIYPLPVAQDAFAARILLARMAERTLDVQYYIWNADTTGILLLGALHDAAERGVRVRLLLDDNNTEGLDRYLAALDAHANIEVRLFNPFVFRSLRWLGYLTDFSRLNRRMHNKSFTADGQVTIIGGRNVGNEYFGASNDMLFSDLDVIGAGPVSSAVSQDFDRYWGSQSSYPVDRLLVPASSEEVAGFSARVSRVESMPYAKTYMDAIRGSELVNSLTEGTLTLEWVPTRMISDDPAKALGLAKPEEMLLARLKQVLEGPSRSLYLVSPYFVPGEQGVDAFSALAADGVKIQILTNSLEATDVAAVHSGYAKRRGPLLEAGIELYESRKSTAGSGRGSRGSVGSSDSSLHAKTFSIDDEHVFIGSFNFDPRSANLNTEMGFIIHSPQLAKQIANAFKNRIPATSYQVKLDSASRLVWVEPPREPNGKPVMHTQEPGTSFWQRATVWFLSLLPIEWLL
jgi:cardiolipin synthase C